MIPAIRTEFRKLATVRSTYVIVALCLIFTAVVAFYVNGYRLNQGVMDTKAVQSLMTGMMQPIGLILSFAAILLVTHEYRYNTIMYTLTSASSRTYVLLAKIVCATAFALALSLIVSLLSPLLLELGLHAKGLTLIAQQSSILDTLPRCLLYGWGSMMFALIIAFIVRNQVGTIAALLLFPGPGEGLLGLLLKENAKYLPFSTLTSVLQNGTPGYSHPEYVLLAYIAGGALIAWALFMRRDAN